MSLAPRIFLPTFVLGLALIPNGRAIGADRTDRHEPEPVRIGLINTLFRDVPESLLLPLMEPFAAVMEARTGMRGELVNAGNAAHLGQMLADGKVQIGVFHGIEFAWARQKHPELRPLVIAINQQDHLHAILLVRKESGYQRLADLKGKLLALPCFTREHCYAFLEQLCRQLGAEPKRFFGKVVKPANLEEALDRLVDGQVDAVVSDGVGLERYQDRKPARFQQLRALAKSEAFPATVVAYRGGGLDGPTLQRFRQGLLDAKTTALGRQLLTLWQLTSFEPVPSDYDQTVAEIVKSYPPRP